MITAQFALEAVMNAFDLMLDRLDKIAKILERIEQKLGD